mgnify:FL=1
MKINKRLRKAFTLVELVVVIAIIAILSTVSVVTYFGITNSAKKSVDDTLITELNKCLQLDETINGKPNTPSEALEVVEENGFTVEKMTPTQDKKEIVWHQTTNKFELVDEITENTTDVTTWRFLSDYTDNHGYSVYLKEGNEATSLDITTGLDVGKNYNVSTINYVGTDTAKSVSIRTNDNDTTLNINAIKDSVKHYEKVGKVNISSVAPNSYHEFGEVQGNIELNNGRVVMESGSKAASVKIVATASDVSSGQKVVSVDNTAASTVSIVVQEDVKNAIDEKGGDNKLTVNSNSVITDADIIANMEKYDGGLGTENSPYLISTADQLTQIEDGKAYALIADVDLSSKSLIFENATYGHISSFKNGILNGNGHSITMAKGASFVNHAEYSKFNDVNFIFNYESNRDQTIIEYSSNLTMTNVHTYGKASMTGNVGLFCLYLGQGEIGNTFGSFTNCVNYADIVGTSYNSLFVGYVFVENNTELNFDGCKNNGSFVSTEGAFYLANCSGNGSTKKTSVTMNIKNSGNDESGIFRVTNVNRAFNPYIYSFGSGAQILVKEDGEVKINATDLKDVPSSLPFNCFIGPNDSSLKLTLNDDKTFTINKSSFTNVAKYVVRVGLYSNLVKPTVGTQIVYVTETIENNGSESFKTTLKNLDFTQTKGTDKGTIGDNASVVEVDGKEYYYFEYENCELNNGTQKSTIFEVLAYDSNGTLVSSYKTTF